MKLRYLGTAAYEGVPAPFCRCRVCRGSFRAGGRALRSRTQALVNDDLLLDFNADTVCHSLMYRISFDNVRDCLITHSHSDHLYPMDLEILSDPISHEHPPLHFYSGEDGYNKIAHEIGLHRMEERAQVTLVRHGDEFRTAGGYRVLALRANHTKETTPLFYAVERDGKRLLYAHDTGVFPEEDYALLKAFGRFDLVSLDCTGCLGLDWDWRNGHMSLKTNLEVMERLRAEGIADEKTVFVAAHFSHNGGQTHAEMVPEMAKHGILVAYDGMELSF